MAFEDFARGGVAIGARVRVADADIEDGTASAVPESMCEDIAAGFIAEGVGWAVVLCGVGVGRGGSGGIAGIVVTGVRSVTIEDGRFDHDSRVGESNAAEVGPFITGIVVADANKPTSFAAESVVQREAGTTAVAEVREVSGAPTVSDGNIIEPLILGEFSATESVWYS
jgi:hypothetical protein